MAAAATIIGIFSLVWTLFKWTWWLLLIIILFAMKKKYEKNPIDAVIIEQRGSNLIKTNDRVGRREDKSSGITYYQLAKIKDTIPVYNFEWVLHNADKPTNIFEKIVAFLRPTMGTIFLYRYGSKQYKPININKKDNKMTLVEKRDEKGEPVFKWEYGQFDPRWVLGILNFQVIDWDNMNFMVQEQRASAVRRAKKGDFLKQFGMAAMILGVTALVALLILKFSADVGRDLRAGVGAQPTQEPSGGLISGAIDNAIAPGG